MPTTNENWFFGGNAKFADATLNDNSITNAKVNSSADIACEKLEHPVHVCYAQEAATDVATGEWVVHVVQGASATLEAVEFGSVAIATSSRTATCDVNINGVSALSAAVVLDTGNTAYVPETATISTTALSDGDVISVELTAGGGAGNYPKGVFAKIKIYEKAT